MKQIVTIMLAALVSLAVVHLWGPKGEGEKVQEAVSDRILRTNVLRCGYATLPPMLVIDPNTREMSGMDYEIIEAVGKKMGVKIEWTVETGYGTASVGMETGKFDMFCNGNWLDARRGRGALASRPYVYNPMFPVVRFDDTRFDQDLKRLNDAQFTIAGLDNDPTMDVAKQDFPKAKTLGWSEFASYAEAAESLTGRKADVFFSSFMTADDYMKKNPNKIRFLFNQPVRFYPVGYQMPFDIKLKGMVDAALEELIVSGEMDKLSEKYMGQDSRNYVPVSRPYQAQ